MQPGSVSYPRLGTEASRKGTWDWDVPADRLYISPGWLEVLGLERLERERAQWKDLLHPEDLASLKRAGGPEVNLECRFRTRDGTWLLTAMNGVVAERDSAGVPVRFRGTVEGKTGQTVRDPLFRTLAEASSSAVAVLDAQLECQFANSRFLHLAGLAETAASGLGWLRMMHPEDREAICSDWMANITPSRPYRAEFRVQDPAGEPRWVALTATEIVEGSSRTGFLALIDDVTVQRKQNEEWRRDRRFLERLAESSPDLICIHETRAHTIQYCNRPEGLLGYTAREVEAMAGTFLTHVCPPEFHTLITERRARLMSATDHETVDSDLAVRHRDGSLCWWRLRESIFSRTPDGTPFQILSIATDITRYIQLQSQLEAEHRRLDLAIHATSDIIFEWSRSTGQSFVSPGFRDLIGASGTDPRNDFDLWSNGIHAEDRLRVQEALASLEASHTPGLVEYRLLMAGGGYRWVQNRWQMVRLPGAEPWITGAMTDIHDRKIAEESLLRYSQDLEDANARAQSADRAKDLFLATLSHEIRAPLNGALNLARLLLDSPLSPAQREWTELLNNSCEGLVSIINNLLDFSRLEAGQLQLVRRPFDLAGLLEEVTAPVRQRAAVRGAPLRCAFSRDLPRDVIGDGARLRQVLGSLFDHVLRLPRQGEMTFSVEPVSSTPAHVVLRFTLTDTAPPASSAASAAEMAGLGVTIARRLVELMSGNISLGGQPASPSLTFTLPLGLPELRDEPRLPSFDLRNVKVLMVGSEADCHSLAGQLRSAQLTVEAAPSADAAIRTLSAAVRSGRPFHFAVVAPMAESVAVAKSIRRDCDYPGTSVILLTAAGQSLNVQETGADACLDAGVRAGEMISLMSALWERRRVEPPSPVADTPAASPPAAALRVLLVEDNEVNQRLGVRLLEKLGCSVDLASNGQEAILLWQAIRYDCIFMDCRMPVMDGYEATHEIRRREAADSNRCRTPIFAFTANSTPGEREKCMDSGMDDFVGKPIRFEHLRSMLETWFGSLPKSEKRVAVGV